MSIYRQQLENYLSGLSVEADRVLDVGGGSNPVNKRVKSWKVKEYKILDNEIEVPVVDVDYRIDLNVGAGFFYDPADIFNRFDSVFCLEVFEYIYDPIQAIKNLNNLLKTNGILYITFPFLYPPHNPIDRDSLRYTKKGAVTMLEKNGFFVEEVIPRRISNYAVYQEFLKSEGYKFKGGSDAGVLFDSGYIIKAIKK